MRLIIGVIVWFIVNFPGYADEHDATVIDAAKPVGAAESSSQQMFEQKPSAAGHEVLLKVFAKGQSRSLSKVEVLVDTTLLLTGPDGVANLTVPLQGSGKILLRKSGYQQLFIDYSDLQTKAAYNAYLYPGEPDDDEVHVLGKGRAAASKKNVTIDETKRIAPAGDPAQIVKLMPGVVTAGYSNDTIIRGSGPYDSIYFVDDISVPMIFHQIGNFSVIPDNMLSEVEFSSGGFGAEYGEATGGVIVLRTTSKVPDRARTFASLNVPFYVTLYHERPLTPDSSLIVSLRHSITEAVIPPLIPPSAGVTLVPTFGDAHARYLRLLDDGFYKVTAIASDDGIKVVAPSDFANNEGGTLGLNTRTRFAVVAVERQKSLGHDLRLKTTPQLSYTDQNIDFMGMYLKGKGGEVGMPTELSWRHQSDKYLYVGVSPTYDEWQMDVKASQPPAPNDPYSDPEDETEKTLKRTFRVTSYAGWVANDFGTRKFTVTPSMRYFYNGMMQKGDVDPRLNVSYKIGDDDVIKTAFGQYSMSPSGQQLSKEFGNPNLKFVKSNHYILGWEHKIGERWSIETQAFYKKIYHLVMADPLTLYNNNGSRSVYGLELFLRRHLTEKLCGWLAYTYAISRDRISASAPAVISQYDKPHVFILAGSYKINPRWDLGTRVEYNSGDTYSKVLGSIYKISFDKFDPIYDVNNPNAGRYPDTHSIDLFASYQSLYDTYKLSYRFGVQTLRLTKPKNSIIYNYDYSEQRLTSLDLPPLPFLEVTGEF